ncbi:hypothetical protein Ddye_018979 [Dipteronia dyeriana]|uniref:Reverse transcriptase domain-containing protein n=1 Tax=Dipteronia dyeriana TaxID=168575 RepID=A0AAD9WU05_9ROSI|nr:hypothetical protein Ddye_018979 [Dipteronia dyeriana]
MPISLVGSLYKVLAKVLANRFKTVLNSVISSSKMAFIKGHQIVDNFVITEEVIHSWKKDDPILSSGELLSVDFVLNAPLEIERGQEIPDE